jgi:hypothetical protein
VTDPTTIDGIDPDLIEVDGIDNIRVGVDPAAYEPSDAEAALAAMPIVRTRRTLSGKSIVEVVPAEIVDDAEPNLHEALDNMVARVRDAAARRKAEREAEEGPAAPEQVVVPDGDGDRANRRAYLAAVKRAQRKGAKAQARRGKAYLRQPQPSRRRALLDKREADAAFARFMAGQS